MAGGICLAAVLLASLLVVWPFVVLTVAAETLLRGPLQRRTHGGWMWGSEGAMSGVVGGGEEGRAGGGSAVSVGVVGGTALLWRWMCVVRRGCGSPMGDRLKSLDASEMDRAGTG
jgi:hypothetical protein